MLTYPLEILPNMATTVNLPVTTYPGKQSCYHPSFPGSISNGYPYYGGEGGGGGGTMSLSHLPIMPPPVKGYCDVNSSSIGPPYDQGQDDLASPDNLISPNHPHEPTFDLTSSPPQSLEETAHHHLHMDSGHEDSLSPTTNVTSPTACLPDHISLLPLPPPLPLPLPTATNSVLHNLPQTVPLQHKPAMFNIPPMGNGLATNGFMGNRLMPGKGSFQHGNATQHHFPHSTHLPAKLNGVPSTISSTYPSITPTSHPATISNFVMYPQHPPPQRIDYHNPVVNAAALRNISYPSSIHSPKLSYDTPRFKLTPERATPLQKWFDEHREHPYPTRHDKILLCQETNLTFTQVSTWFANCRRRMKKACQEDEEKQHSNGGTSNSTANSSPHYGTTNGAYNGHDEATPPRQRSRSRSPMGNCSPGAGCHDTEEKIHNYGRTSQEFVVTYSRNSPDESTLLHQH